MVKIAKKLKGDKKAPIQSAAFSLLRASALMAQAAVHNPDDMDGLWKLNKRVNTALSKIETTLWRAEM